MNADEQYRRIEVALVHVGMDIEPDVRARQLYAAGVRVLKLDETILSRSDAMLLDHVRLATENWEAAKTAARAEPKSESWVESKESLILAAFHGAGKPLTPSVALRAAAGWHQDYRPPATEWDPWRDAWRRLVAQRQVRKTNAMDLGVEMLWEPVKIDG